MLTEEQIQNVSKKIFENYGHDGEDLVRFFDKVIDLLHDLMSEQHQELLKETFNEWFFHWVINKNLIISKEVCELFLFCKRYVDLSKKRLLRKKAAIADEE